jgi:hypothetical protein
VLGGPSAGKKVAADSEHVVDALIAAHSALIEATSRNAEASEVRLAITNAFSKSIQGHTKGDGDVEAVKKGVSDLTRAMAGYIARALERSQHAANGLKVSAWATEGCKLVGEGAVV